MSRVVGTGVRCSGKFFVVVVYLVDVLGEGKIIEGLILRVLFQVRYEIRHLIIRVVVFEKGVGVVLDVSKEFVLLFLSVSSIFSIMQKTREFIGSIARVPIARAHTHTHTHTSSPQTLSLFVSTF